MKANILIVDDHEDNRLALADALDGEGYVIREAADGASAIEACRHHSFDTILLDVRMPSMSGIECCRRLRSHQPTARIPIVLVTGLCREEDIIEGFNAGAMDYVTKPFSAPVVLARIRATLRSKRMCDELEARNAEVGRLAEALRCKNKRLAELTDTAHRFVDNVAHEFRTPLSVIKEFSAIIVDGLGGPVTPMQRECLEFVEASTRELARMVDDFLDSSKLKARTLRVDRCPSKIDEIFSKVRPVLDVRARQKRIEVVESIDPTVSTVFADPEKVSRVLVNLAVNAVKFSPEESSIELWSRPVAGGGAEVGVTDHGAGLAPEDVSRVFQRFKQVGDVERSSTKGFGLGLNIAKELIWLNLGSVRVESELGQGSTFAFTLPPCDPGVILEWYVDRQRELDLRPEAFSLLEVRVGDADVSAEALRGQLVAECHPTDVAFVVPGDLAVLLFGCTAEPDQWIERLKTSAVGVRLPSLEAECLGTWSCDRAAEAIGSVLSRLTEAGSYAAA